MIDRFNPDEESCIPLALDRITDFFGISLATESVVQNVRNINDIMSYFKEIDLEVEGFFSNIFLLNPRYWAIFLKGGFKNIKKCYINAEKERCALLYFTSGNELYGVKECWNHVVVEFFDKKRTYYDSYIPVISHDHPELRFTNPTHEELQSQIVSICLVIRSKKNENSLLWI